MPLARIGAKAGIDPSVAGMISSSVHKDSRYLDENRCFVFPVLPPDPYNPPVPHRIHRKAFRRGGAGAGVEGKTQSLNLRVRGKWSPSGDTGRGDGQRTGPSSLDARKSAPGVPVRHTGWPNGWFRRTFLSVRVKRMVRRRRHGSLAITRFARGPCGQTNTVREGQGRGTEVADKNRRTGR